MIKSLKHGRWELVVSAVDEQTPQDTRDLLSLSPFPFPSASTRLSYCSIICLISFSQPTNEHSCDAPWEAITNRRNGAAASRHLSWSPGTYRSPESTPSRRLLRPCGGTNVAHPTASHPPTTSLSFLLAIFAPWLKRISSAHPRLGDDNGGLTLSRRLLFVKCLRSRRRMLSYHLSLTVEILQQEIGGIGAGTHSHEGLSPCHQPPMHCQDCRCAPGMLDRPVPLGCCPASVATWFPGHSAGRRRVGVDTMHCRFGWLSAFREFGCGTEER